MSDFSPGTYPGSATTPSGQFVYGSVPAAADYALINFGANDTLSDLTGQRGGIRLQCTTVATQNLRIAQKDGTTSILARINWLSNGNDASTGFFVGGVVLRNSTSGRIIAFGCQGQSGIAACRAWSMVQNASVTAADVDLTRINPFTGVVGGGTCRGSIYNPPKWLGLKIVGANTLAYMGFDDYPGNFFLIATGSGGGTYVTGGGGTLDKVGIYQNPLTIGADTLSPIDVHSAYVDSVLP